MENEEENYYIDDLSFLGDLFSNYLKYIKKFPPLPKSEIFDLGIKAMNGDSKASEKLILHHLAFVVFRAKPYFRRYPNVDPMDIVQYGNEGLMKAVSMYDPHDGALTTYSASWIDQKISRYLRDDFADITIPEHAKFAINKYQRLLDDAKINSKEMPTDEELCKMFKVQQDTLNLIKEQATTRVVSINEKINDDGDDLEHFIKDENARNTDDILSSFDLFESLIAIKSRLKPVLYYVFYMRHFDKCEHTLEEIAEELNITRERVRQLEEQAKEKVKHLFDNNQIQRTVRELKLKEKSKFYKLDERPIQPKEIIKYLFLRRYFSGIRRDILRSIILHSQKLTDKERAQQISIDYGEFKNLLDGVKLKVEKILRDKQNEYINFSNDVKNTYGTKIFEIDLGIDYSKCDYKDIMKRYSFMSFPEIKKLYGEGFEDLPVSTKKLLYRFFEKTNYKIVYDNFVEREVNLALFNYKNKSPKLSLSTLYPTYLKYKDSFNEEQQIFLEYYFFKTKDLKELKIRLPREAITMHKNITIRKLEKYHFGVQNIYFYPGLTKELYEDLLEKYSDVISDERKRLLNLCYGVGCEKKSLQQIVNDYNLDYTKTHDFFRKSKDFVYNLYLNRNSKKIIDKDIYSGYILNEVYELTKETREILKMHVISGLSYDEISLKTGLSKARVSNIVTDGIRKIDFYRFGIIKATIIEEEMLEDFFKNYKILFSDLEQKIIRLKFINHLNMKEIKDILDKEKKISKDFINETNSRFIRSFNEFLIKDVSLTPKILATLINKRPLESVLNPQEKEVISYSCGIKNKLNPTGKIYSAEEITKFMGISIYQYYHFKHNGLKKMKMNIAGLLEPMDIYLPLDVLEKDVLDMHIPISDKERMIINYFCGLNGYYQKNFVEIAKVMGISEGSVKRRYQRAIVSIYKYKAGEENARLDYESDIAPNLKYFCKQDKLLINEYFKNGLSCDEIAKKYSISVNKIRVALDGIIARIDDILKNPQDKRFDYDYAESVLENNDFPFNGNLEVAKNIYRLSFCGEGVNKITMTEIIKQLNLDILNSLANDILSNFMVSICKYRMGIKYDANFSYETIKDYFDRNEEKMSKYRLQLYNKYFERQKKSVGREFSYVCDTIRYDLLKDQETAVFSLATTSKSEVLKNIKK